MANYFDVLVLVYLVKTVFVRNACCVIVEVTRREMDTFTCSTDKMFCYTYDGKYDICKSWNASAVKSGKQTPNKLRLCTCMCQRQSSTFLESVQKCVLNTEMRNDSTISNWAYLLSGINYLGAPLVIKPYSMVMVINFKINKNYNNVGNANNCSIPYKVELAGKRNWIQIDKFFLNKTVNKPDVQNGAYSVANLTLNWQKGRIPLIRGRVIRIRIKCHFAQNQIVDNFIIFKVNGTFSVNNITEGSITLSSFISPTPSTVIGTTQVFSIVSTVSASYQHYSMRTSLSSPSTLYESTSFSLISPTTMSSSATNSSSPEKQSKDSSAKAILIGAVIGTVLALVIAFLIIFYILRKKKQKQTFSGKHDPGEGGFNNAMTNKNCPHVLDNPLCQNEAYESLKAVESDKKHSSGVNIDNANYDQCLVVENLSARNIIPSVYDNVPEQKGEDEHAYHPLDPTKREPSSKYQSLIKPENEYSIISDDAGSTSLQEPLYYSTVNDDAPKNLNRTSDNQPKPDPVYNVLEANDSTVQTASDPVYNVLEQSNEEEGEGEPVYNVLEQSGEIQGKQEAVYSELESK